MKNPDGAAFLELVMKRVGAANPTDLSKLLGEPWTSRDQQRRLYKWASGEAAPNFHGTVALLRLAGMLNAADATEAAALPARPAGSTDARLEALEAKLDRQGRATTRTLKALEAQLSHIRDLLEPPGREATEDHQ